MSEDSFVSCMFDFQKSIFEVFIFVPSEIPQLNYSSPGLYFVLLYIFVQVKRNTC